MAMSFKNNVYDEVSEKSVAKGFKNSCYKETNNDRSKHSKGRNEGLCIKKLLLALFLVVLVLMLGIACACVAFALEISNLKSTEISSAAEQDFIKDLNNSINQLQTMISNTSFDVQGLTGMTQQLNASLALEFSALIQQLNVSLNNHFIQSFSAINEKIQSLNVSIDSVNSSIGSGQHPNVAADSCAALPPSSPSGYYWIRSFKGFAVRVYCDMARSCGGITGGWMRVAELDMRNSSQHCPSGLTQRNDPGLRTCVKSTQSRGCSSLDNFAPSNIYYSKVCGKIIAYQFGTTDAFNHGNINSDYVDGFSLTHGNPRQHIWTFASAYSEASTQCQCINPLANSDTSPSFVRNDYFCDTGAISGDRRVLHSHDPLWDGAGCGPRSVCCSFNTPPWFYKQLQQSTPDDIEVRVCRNEDKFNEDIAVSQIELYVQ